MESPFYSLNLQIEYKMFNKKKSHGALHNNIQNAFIYPTSM